uniref:WD repeat-containing protein 18 n=1 Tax=Hucho hucho TaxID=62062 RepID=A0A4W5N9W1_9TELE
IFASPVPSCCCLCPHYGLFVSTGNLLAILNRHYQDLTCKDNLALVWSLVRYKQLLHWILLSLWELSSGEMLLSVLFDVGIMSVTLDPCEYYLFCGGSDGGIFQVSLCSQGNQVFKGHRKLVTCLSVSMDGTLLLSGSHDETIRLWDIQSKQSIRSINHKGPVTNARIIPAPANMFLPDSRPGIPLPRFSWHLNPLEQGEGTETGGVCLRLAPHTQWVFGDGENTKVRVSVLEEEVRTLKKVNKDLYDFSTQLLTKPS